MFHRLPAAVDHRAESKPSDDEDSLDEEDSDSKTDIPDVRVIPCVERKQIQKWGKRCGSGIVFSICLATSFGRLM